MIEVNDEDEVLLGVHLRRQSKIDWECKDTKERCKTIDAKRKVLLLNKASEQVGLNQVFVLLVFLLV